MKDSSGHVESLINLIILLAMSTYFVALAE